MSKHAFRRKAWCISSDGTTHLPHPTKASKTLCLKNTQQMKKSWDGSLMTDCDCCKAVVRREVELEIAHDKEKKALTTS